MGPKPQTSGGAADPLRQSYPGAALAAGPTNVFMGTLNRTVPNAQGHAQERDRSALGTSIQSNDTFMGVDQAKASIYGWNDAQVAAFKAQAFASGLYGGNKPPAGNIVDPATQQIWEKLVEQAAAYNLAGRKLTPNDILGMYAAGAGGGQGPTTHKSTSTSVHLSDITEAKGVLDQVFQDKLGRSVTNGEAKAFLGALNAQQRAHPSRTSSTQTTDASGNSSSSSSTTDAGFDAGQYAKDYSRQQYGREIDTRTIGVDYYHAALQAIGALV